MTDLIAKLNKALKPKGTSGPQGTFRHENEEAILTAAKNLLIKSETGQELLAFAADNNIEMHVLRNKQDYGFLPDKSTVYITCPAGQSMPTARAVIHLAGALRQAQQEISSDLASPKLQIGRERFARQLVEKRKDFTIYQAAVVYELTENTELSEILDEFAAMGYRSLYEAYRLDVIEASGGSK